MPASRLAALALLLLPAAVRAEPLHQEIDRLIAAKAAGKPAAARSDDAEFLRRVHLDLAGRIPTTAEARAFLADAAADKRVKLVDQLLTSPDYPRRMADLFHVMLMERLGDHADWAKYLHDSFAANKPWDQMAREILGGRATDPAQKGSTFFYVKRLENYGQNPVDYPALTRDVGRLFLGMDLQCAQCHNHMFIKGYKQADFQGLHAFFQNTFLPDPKGLMVGEKPTTQKVSFQSVFNKEPKQTAPRIPGLSELEIPAIAKGKEFATPPDPKTKAPGILAFSPLASLAEQLPTADNPAFARNMANRLWWALTGRGLVHPLDLHHDANPPSHPELLDLLAREFTAHQFDIKWLLREIALSETYQRSSVLPAERPAPELFLAAQEKRLSADQLMNTMLEATGERTTVTGLDAVRAKFVRAFANPRREPETEFSPSLKAALFVLNDDLVLSWLTPKDSNLVGRLAKLDDGGQVAEEAYLAVLTRLPSAAEKADVAAYLAKHPGDERAKALRNLCWALLACTEFGVNH